MKWSSVYATGSGSVEFVDEYGVSFMCEWIRFFDSEWIGTDFDLGNVVCHEVCYWKIVDDELWMFVIIFGILCLIWKYEVELGIRVSVVDFLGCVNSDWKTDTDIYDSL